MLVILAYAIPPAASIRRASSRAMSSFAAGRRPGELENPPSAKPPRIFLARRLQNGNYVKQASYFL